MTEAVRGLRLALEPVADLLDFAGLRVQDLERVSAADPVDADVNGGHAGAEQPLQRPLCGSWSPRVVEAVSLLMGSLRSWKRRGPHAVKRPLRAVARRAMTKPGKQSGRQYTEAEVAILERALRDTQARGVSHDELVAAAEEIASRGVPSRPRRATSSMSGAGRRRARPSSRSGARGSARTWFSFRPRERVPLRGERAHGRAVVVLPGRCSGGAWARLSTRSARSPATCPRGRSGRELERSAAQARKEQHRRLKEQRRAERLERKQRLEQSAEDFGHAVEEGVATLPRGSRRRSAGAPAAGAGRGGVEESRIAPLDAEEAEFEELGEEEADRAARRGRGER